MNNKRKHTPSTKDVEFTFKWVAKKVTFFYKVLEDRNIQTQEEADEIENKAVFEAIDTDAETLQEWAKRFIEREVFFEAVERTVNASQFLKENYNEAYEIGLAQTVILTILYKRAAKEFLAERRHHELSN